jgi:FkbM family methyltransferase
MIIPLDKIIRDYNLRIKGVLHIGAHYGQEYEDYVRNGVDNMIFFEPVKSNFEELARRLPTPTQTTSHIRILNVALGNETGTKEMFTETTNLGMSCSLLEPGTHLKTYPHIKFDGREIVKIDKLDNIPFARDGYNMINIDVQGYELEVFRGAVGTLPSIDIIYTEVNFEDVYKKCCHVEDLDYFLGPWGFERVLTDARYGTWGDALYLKKCHLWCYLSAHN